MTLYGLTSLLIRRAEKQLGVDLDYTRKIAQTDLRLLLRYSRLFGFLDPNRHVSAAAYHTARLRGAVALDCGTCVVAEINLAKAAGLADALINTVLEGTFADLPENLAAVAALTDSVVRHREDDPENREIVIQHYGEAGLIELSFAMNGAALLPGIKRTMGYAVSCDLDVVRKLTGRV